MLIVLQVTPTTSSAPLCTVPPGPCSVVISNVSGVTAYIGAGGVVTTGNGFPIPTGAPPVTISAYPGSKSQALTVIGGSGSITGAVGVMISTPQ